MCRASASSLGCGNVATARHHRPPCPFVLPQRPFCLPLLFLLLLFLLLVFLFLPAAHAQKDASVLLYLHHVHLDRSHVVYYCYCCCYCAEQSLLPGQTVAL